jgi:hypothetical protein
LRVTKIREHSGPKHPEQRIVAARIAPPFDVTPGLHCGPPFEPFEAFKVNWRADIDGMSPMQPERT